MKELLTGANLFSVAPNRQSIAATLRRPDPGMEPNVQTRFALIKADTHEIIELPSTATVRRLLYSHDLVSFQVTWSPDSTKLLFTRGEEMWIVNANDTGLQRLMEGYAPQWSPDGVHIAFLRSPQREVYELWAMRVETA